MHKGGVTRAALTPLVLCTRSSYCSSRKLVLICHPMKGRRLSRPGWLVTYQDDFPVHIQIVTQ